MLIYIVSAALCCLFVAETILIAHNFRVYTINPPSSKLLFLAEAVKLVLASCFYASESRISTHSGLPSSNCLDVGKGRLRLCKEKLLSEGTAMLVFAAPAVCYFITNNLTFFALELMPAHNYVLLSDLRIITTCFLSYLVLRKVLSRRAIISLLLLCTGICMGHWATMPSDTSNKAQPASSQVSSNDGLQQWLLGGFVMVVYSMLSAVAAVYLEWVMNHSPSYRHESLNLQNIRLYTSGTLMNGVMCYTHVGGAAMTSINDMMPAHWALVASLACMGLVTALVIKRYGNIVKIYASCIASLLAAGISQALFKHPPPAAFYIACMMATVATLQLQKARAADAAAVAGDGVKCSNDSKASFCSSTGAAGWLRAQGRTQSPMQLTALFVLVCSLLATSLYLGGMRSGSRVQQHMVNTTSTAETNSPPSPTDPSLLGQSCHARAAVSNLVPFEPTCFSTDRQQLGCPVLNCSVDPGCSMRNTSCCAYLNYEMLRFLSWFFPSKCLQNDYLWVYGTALGAVRNQSILGHTQDVDVGITPLAVQYLELNSTRQELWQHGYSFWYDRGSIWRMCPHLHHPSPHFQAVMVNPKDPGYQEHSKRTWAAYVDFYMMWQVSWNISNCQQTNPNTNMQEQLDTPWDAMFEPGHSAATLPTANTTVAAGGGQVSGTSATREVLTMDITRSMSGTHISPGVKTSTPAADVVSPDSCSAQLSQQDPRASIKSKHKYCVWYGGQPLSVVPESQRGKIGNLSIPLAHNIEEHLHSAYGPGWRNPDDSNHGVNLQNVAEAVSLQQALLKKLAVTAWGSMPYETRVQQCHNNSKKATALADDGVSRYTLDKLDRFCA